MPVYSSATNSGSPIIDFSLKGTDGKIYSPESFKDKDILVIIFQCNHCPYVKAVMDRFVALQEKYSADKVQLIAINPNDPQSSPGDSFDEMKKHAASNKFTFPYLYDEGQLITTAYGAKNTPHVFVMSKTARGNIVEYTGAIDNDAENTDAAKTKYVEDAISALLNNSKPAITVTKAIGCRISWKKTQ